MAIPESLATGITGGITSLEEAWTAIQEIHDGDKSVLNFEDREVFDILRGWPNEGALGGFFPIDTSGAGTGTITKGQFVQFSGTDDKVELATGADLDSEAPKQLMLALDDSSSTTVVAAGSLPVLTTNYVVRTDQLYGSYGDDVATNFPLGAPVYVVDGLVTPDKTEDGATSLQVLGYVRGINVTTTTVDIEVK